jgi:hypothetical protein
MASHNITLSTIYDTEKQMDQFQLLMPPSESVQDLVKQQTLKEPKLVQLDKVLYKLFTTVSSKGKSVMEPTIEKTMFLLR